MGSCDSIIGDTCPRRDPVWKSAPTISHPCLRSFHHPTTQEAHNEHNLNYC